MNENNVGVIPKEIQETYEKSLELYPNSIYKPKLHVTSGYSPGTLRGFNYSEEKLMRYHGYCFQNNKRVRIDTYEVEREYRDVQAPGSPVRTMVIVTGFASVSIDDYIVSKAAASQVCFLDDISAMDSIVQLTLGMAKSNALSNAGFGVYSGPDFEASGAQSQEPPEYPQGAPRYGVPSGNAGQQAPSNPSAPPQQNPGPAPAGHQPGQAMGTAGAQQNPGNQQQVIPGMTQDPIAAAKAVVCTKNGRTKGMKMGEVLATNPKDIIYMAEQWNRPGDPSKEAAIVLLNLAKKACGQA